MFCKKCGTKLPDEINICPSCYFDLQNNLQLTQEQAIERVRAMAQTAQPTPVQPVAPVVTPEPVAPVADVVTPAPTAEPVPTIAVPVPDLTPSAQPTMGYPEPVVPDIAPLPDQPVQQPAPNPQGYQQPVYQQPNPQGYQQPAYQAPYPQPGYAQPPVKKKGKAVKIVLFSVLGLLVAAALAFAVIHFLPSSANKGVIYFTADNSLEQITKYEEDAETYDRYDDGYNLNLFESANYYVTDDNIMYFSSYENGRVTLWYLDLDKPEGEAVEIDSFSGSDYSVYFYSASAISKNDNDMVILSGSTLYYYDYKEDKLTTLRNDAYAVTSLDEAVYVRLMDANYQYTLLQLTEDLEFVTLISRFDSVYYQRDNNTSSIIFDDNCFYYAVDAQMRCYNLETGTDDLLYSWNADDEYSTVINEHYYREYYSTEIYLSDLVEFDLSYDATMTEPVFPELEYPSTDEFMTVEEVTMFGEVYEQETIDYDAYYDACDEIYNEAYEVYAAEYEIYEINQNIKIAADSLTQSSIAISGYNIYKDGDLYLEGVSTDLSFISRNEDAAFYYTLDSATTTMLASDVYEALGETYGSSWGYWFDSMVMEYYYGYTQTADDVADESTELYLTVSDALTSVYTLESGYELFVLELEDDILYAVEYNTITAEATFVTAEVETGEELVFETVGTVTGASSDSWDYGVAINEQTGEVYYTVSDENYTDTVYILSDGKLMQLEDEVYFIQIYEDATFFWLVDDAYYNTYKVGVQNDDQIDIIAYDVPVNYSMFSSFLYLEDGSYLVLEDTGSYYGYDLVWIDGDNKIVLDDEVYCVLYAAEKEWISACY